MKHVPGEISKIIQAKGHGHADPAGCICIIYFQDCNL